MMIWRRFDAGRSERRPLRRFSSTSGLSSRRSAMTSFTASPPSTGAQRPRVASRRRFGGAGRILGSTAQACIDTQQYQCVGQEINANHVRPALGSNRGTRARCTWAVARMSGEITNEAGEVAFLRLTVAVIHAVPSTPGEGPLAFATRLA